MFKKIFLVAMATLLTTSLIACKSDSEEKVDTAQDHINVLNDINQQLANKGVVVITSYRYSSTLSTSANYSNAELAEIVTLLKSFVSHGNIVLDLTNDPDIYWGDDYKLQNAIDNANHLLNQASSYDTSETRIARANQRAEQERIAHAARREREAQERTQQELNNATYNSLIETTTEGVYELKAKKIYLNPNSTLQGSSDLISREQIKNMSLKDLEETSVALSGVITSTSAALTMIRVGSVRVTYTDRTNLENIKQKANTYLPIVRARIQGITNLSPKAEATTGNSLGTVYSKDAVGE